MGRLWRNGTRTPVDVVGCDTVVSPRKPAIGAPTAMARTAPTRSLFVFIGECPSGLGSRLWARTRVGARRARLLLNGSLHEGGERLARLDDIGRQHPAGLRAE